MHRPFADKPPRFARRPTAQVAIPEHVKLARDLHAPSWSFDLRQLKIATKKDVLKKLLGRSPDHGDAFTLVCWDNAAAARWAAKDEEERPGRPYQKPAAYGLDPYAGLDAWQRGG
jgi:hypothetical protein